MMFEDKLEKIKKEIRSVIITFPNGVSLPGFLKAYKQLLGNRLPTREFGYTSDVDFLHSLPDVIHIRTDRRGEYELKCIADENTMHIQKLISKQRVNKPKNSYFSSKPLNIVGSNTFRVKPFVSAQLRENLFKILSDHPDGISYSSLHAAYQKMFKNQLNLDFLSENHHERLKKLASVVSELEVKEIDNTERLFFFPRKLGKMNSCVESPSGLSSYKPFRATTLEEILGNEVQDEISYVCAVPLIVKNNFEKIMKQYPNGILARHFPALYEKSTGEIFDINDLGFNNLLELVDTLPEIFFYKMHENPNDWILFPTSFKKNGSQLKDKTVPAPPSKKFNDMNGTCKLDMLCDTVPPTMPYIKPKLSSDINLTEYVPVFISAIISPSRFWFKLQSESVVSKFRDLEEKMQSFYNSDLNEVQKLLINDIIVGATCAALHDDYWYRVTVVSSLQSERVNVYLVDYGSCEKVKRSSLRYLKYEFNTLPAQAFKAELAFVKPLKKTRTWTVKAEKRFFELCNNPCLMARIHSECDDVLSVFLCDISGEDDIHVNDVLIDEGLAENDIDCLRVEKGTVITSTVNRTSTTESNNDVLTQKSVINKTRKETELLKFVKRVALGDGYKIHIIVVAKQAYVSVGDLCNLFWHNKSSEMLKSRLELKNTEIPSISISKENYSDIFQQSENFSVQDFQHASLSQYSVELYPLSFVMKVLNVLGHPSITVRETIKKEVQNFDPFSEDWGTSDVDDMNYISYKNEEGINNLCMYDLKVLHEAVKCKRMKLQSDLEKNRGDNVIKELKQVEKFHSIIKNRIDHIESICSSYSSEEN